MKKIIFAFIAITLLCSHDMFLKFDFYQLEPNHPAVLQLFNGTFDISENVIDRNRMNDASLVGNGFRYVIDSTQWYDRDETTFLNFSTGNAGTWVAGVSTAPRNISMEAGRFNNYLEHDGVVDMLLSRKQNNQLEQDATEKYSKHVKTIFQVGDLFSNDYATQLGYPIEFVPMINPYKLHAGHDMKVKLLKDGVPLTNQLVLIGSDANKSSHTHDENGNHTNETSDATLDVKPLELRTDENGILQFKIDHPGIWHLRTIHMIESQDENLTHESNWATLTFEIGAGDGHEHTDHVHDEDSHHHEKPEFPSYIFWISSLVVVIGLFLYFKNK